MVFQFFTHSKFRQFRNLKSFAEITGNKKMFVGPEDRPTQISPTFFILWRQQKMQIMALKRKFETAYDKFYDQKYFEYFEKNIMTFLSW